MPGQDSQLEALTQINVQDFLVSLGLENMRQGRRLVEALCWYPSLRFARQMIAYDQDVAENGLSAASRRALNNYVGGLEIVGAENLPAEGPLLVLSNHPGMTDTLALFASLPRPDLQIIAAVRPFLQNLYNVNPYLIYVPDDPAQRMGVVRSAVAHLRRAGAVLTFPAGKIEPDPASMPGAEESLAAWSESVAIFTRMVPETTIVVAIVSGVIWKAALEHPITRLRKDKEAQERLGATLQVLVHTSLPFVHAVRNRVTYSAPLRAAERPSDPQALMQLVRQHALRLIESAPHPISG
jgi:hypothetical protein